jgi:hypothetical protein
MEKLVLSMVGFPLLTHTRKPISKPAEKFTNSMGRIGKKLPKQAYKS